MLKNPQDRRARRTASQIKNVMLRFLEKKALHEISVSEICKVCQINRATFYDHYRDIFDLAQDIERDILTQLQELMDCVIPEDTPGEEISQLFFAFFSKNQHVMQLLLTGERRREFYQRLDHMIMPFFEQKARQTYVVPKEKERELRYALQFIASGYYSFFMQTLDGTSEPADAVFIKELSDACLSSTFEKIT